MRLFELINFKPAELPSVRSPYPDIESKTKAQYLGSGSFASVYDTQSNKRLNQVTKIGTAGYLDKNGNLQQIDNPEGDGYLAYLMAVDKLQQAGNQNPYFPRIHDLKIRKGRTGRLVYSVNLEKLYPLYTTKIIGNVPLMKSLIEHMFVGTYEKSTFINDGAVIANYLDRSYHNSSFINDPKLKSALDIISKIISSATASGIRLQDDIRDDNVMWRITGNMPQLVIVDPIA